MIDLHIHTTCSDGQLTVEQLLEKANNAGISVISFCDHNVYWTNWLYKKFLQKKNSLLITGGSDFHREQKQTLGYGANGTIPITEEYCLKNYTQIELHER